MVTQRLRVAAAARPTCPQGSPRGDLCSLEGRRLGLHLRPGGLLSVTVKRSMEGSRLLANLLLWESDRILMVLGLKDLAQAPYRTPFFVPIAP